MLLVERLVDSRLAYRYRRPTRPGLPKDQLQRRAAAGIDGITWDQYEADLEGNLADLHGRVQRGAYRAKPSRRQYIPKSDGRQRPLGIAALEDKIVQRAVVEVLNAGEKSSDDLYCD